jgi:hypothetical protein
LNCVTQDCRWRSNPGLKLANAFGVFQTEPVLNPGDKDQLPLFFAAPVLREKLGACPLPGITVELSGIR